MKLRIIKRWGSYPRQAFSILEAVIGMALCGTVILAMYGALISGFNVVRLSQENLRATQILIEKMEICRLYSWEQITEPKFFPKHFEIGQNPTFKGKMQIKKGPDDVEYKDEMKQITIEITWKSGKQTRSREFVTYVVRNGLQSYFY